MRRRNPTKLGGKILVEVGCKWRYVKITWYTFCYVFRIAECWSIFGEQSQWHTQLPEFFTFVLHLLDSCCELYVNVISLIFHHNMGWFQESIGKMKDYEKIERKLTLIDLGNYPGVTCQMGWPSPWLRHKCELGMDGQSISTFEWTMHMIWIPQSTQPTLEGPTSKLHGPTSNIVPLLYSQSSTLFA